MAGFFGQLAKTNFDNPAGRYAGTSASGSGSASAGGLGSMGLYGGGTPIAVGSSPGGVNGTSTSQNSGMGTSLGRQAGNAYRSYTATGGGNTNGAGPGADVGGIYSLYSQAANAQNAMDFAKLDANLKAMYGEAGAQKIQAQLADQMRGVDAGLAQQLAGIANEGYAADKAGVDRAVNANTALYDLRGQGRANAELYNNQQRDVIRQALDNALGITAANRAEGNRVHDLNIRKISGAFGARGSYGSTARFESDADQHGILADLLERARIADLGANNDWTSQSQGIDKAQKDIANAGEIDKRETWEKGLSLVDRKGEIDRQQAQQAAQLAAAEQQRAIQAQQAQAQLEAYYTQIQNANDAANAQKWYETIEAQRQAGIATMNQVAQQNAGKVTTHKTNVPARDRFR